MKVCQMRNGENEMVVAALKIDEKISKGGKAYSVLSCSDGENIVEVKVWKTNEEVQKRIQLPVVVSAVIDKQIYNGNPSYIMNDFCSTSEPIDPFIPHAPIDPEKCYQQIYELVQTCPDSNLREITSFILEQNKTEFISMPAAKLIHHNYLYGLLYHSYRMLKTASALVTVFPNINKYLLYCGVILHDIGKVNELCCDELGNIDYTIDGNLLGHCMIGIQMIERATIELQINPNAESVKLLEHLIASHHGDLDMGAIVKPMIPEAMLLHEIDMIESRMWQYEKAMNETEPGTLSEKMFGLGNVMVYHSEL